jgi:hypothetical protein
MQEIDVTGWLASSLGRNDEQPNIELAVKIASTGNKTAIGILVKNLSNRDKNIQSDCIKVLYETGYRNPELLADNAADFLALLKSKNNRLNWGAMIAIDCIADVDPGILFQNLSDIMSAVDKGSVITRDHGVSILIKLSKNRDYSEFTLPLLFEQLKTCPVNQLAMYAENALPVISGDKRAEFTAILESRMGELQKESQKSRIEKAIKKLNSGKVR